jgi:hypothetical protein
MTQVVVVMICSFAGRMRPPGHSLETLGLDNPLMEGGGVVSLTHQPHSTPQKYFLFLSGTHF